MASESQIDSAIRHSRYTQQRPIIGEGFTSDDVYIQYEMDMERIQQQQKDALGVLQYYRDTDLIPTNRRLIPDDKDLDLLIGSLGLESID